MTVMNSWMAKGMAEGLRQGEARGEARGVERGRREGELNLVQRQLTRKLGRLPVRLRKKVEQLPTPDLEALGEAIFDLTSTADVSAWLEQRRV